MSQKLTDNEIKKSIKVRSEGFSHERQGIRMGAVCGCLRLLEMGSRTEDLFLIRRYRQLLESWLPKFVGGESQELSENQLDEIHSFTTQKVEEVCKN
jgi:hypothetical protein